jgi:hypothetical protein
MAFQVSPGVLVKEIDLTNVVPAVATSIGAIAGQFNIGPVGEVTSISSEEQLIQVFGKPDSNNFESFFTAANFLQYGNALRVVRAEKAGMLNADSDGSGIKIINDSDYDDNHFNNGAGGSSAGNWASRFPGSIGNSIGVSMCTSASAFEETFSGNTGTLGVVEGTPAAGATTVSIDNGGGSAGAGGALFNVGDIVHFFETDGSQYEITAIATDALTIRQLDNPNGGGLKSALADATNVRRRWRFYDQVDGAPSTSVYAASKNLTLDEMHVVVYDRDGGITGSDSDLAGSRGDGVIEVFPFVSQIGEAKTPQGNTNYYVNVVNVKSEHIRWMNHDSSIASEAGTTLAGGNAYTPTSGKGGVVLSVLAGGSNGTTAASPSVGELDIAYQLFADTATVDVNLVMAGTCPAGTDGVAHATMIIDLCEARKDCVGFISPRRADVVSIPSSITQTSNVITFFDQLASSSYAVFDSGYKYMYDKYADVYRFVPLNGDVAGLCANTDQVADAWFSPAGFNRGQIRGAVKLAYNPNKAQRDEIYPARINPVISEPGEGTLLFGDKTALSRPSAFDRINVRRLFLVLEKAIATAAKFQLFEFNDDFTRAQFLNLVEPFLRDVQGRRGITDFSVVCDDSNNTGEVIDRNEFVGDIFIKPARSINFITLNFIAVRTGVEFSEVGG